ncbi:MAG: trigger factor [Patescibacteria group bacterium]|nr:trigger factor [Patescibacteria group bacterium]
MKLSRENPTPTTTKLIIAAELAELEAAKKTTLARLSKNVAVPGFRKGKAPVKMIEKQIDPSVMQAEFIDAVLNQLYVQAIDQEKMRPVAQPEIAVAKFVPFTTLEFTATVETVGDIKLPAYKKIKQPLKNSKVTEADVDGVLKNLALRGAVKEPVERAAKKEDELIIDFTGVDAKTKEVIDGADGKDYPLLLGSNTFIPGFEDELVGAKPAAVKTFDITFPADYGAAALQSRKVTFTVTVKAVNEVKPAKIDDAFAATLGPFKSVSELKVDVKKQLQAERDQEDLRTYDNELLQKVADKTEVAVPTPLVDDEIERMEDEEKRNTAYRGQTWQEHLDAEGLTAEEHKEKQRAGAETRVKAGLVLGEIAQAENITVSPDELEIRIELLRGQYSDPAMQSELDKPENRRDIMSRMLTEKTLETLRGYATSK